MKKIVGIITILLVLAGMVLFFYSRQKAQAATEIKTTAVTRGTLKIAFSIDGKTVMERRDPTFTINGKVVHIAVQEGQEVKRGQYLMALDTRDIQKNLEITLKNFLINRNDFDETTQVAYPNGALTDTIKRVLEKNQYNLDKAVMDVELKDIALKESYLYSPIDGTVSVINVKEGETVNTQGTNSIITITKPDSLSFEAYAEDIEVLKINPTQQVSVKLDALSSATFTAAVQFISHLATVDQNGLSTYKITANLNNPYGTTILDGMTGQITFTTKERQNILIIPNKAVHRKNNSSYVTVKKGTTYEEIAVTTEFTDGKSVEVTKGLKEGDLVVVP